MNLNRTECAVILEALELLSTKIEDENAGSDAEKQTHLLSGLLAERIERHIRYLDDTEHLQAFRFSKPNPKCNFSFVFRANNLEDAIEQVNDLKNTHGFIMANDLDLGFDYNVDITTETIEATDFRSIIYNDGAYDWFRSLNYLLQLHKIPEKTVPIKPKNTRLII